MSNAFQNRIGVTTEERVINAFNLGSDISTRNIGLLVARERGIPNKPILVNNLKEDVRIFGQHKTNMYSSYVVETLFNNTGGYPANVYQVRLVGEGSVAASKIVDDALIPASLVGETTQNANATQGQITEVSALHIESGYNCEVQVQGTDDLGNGGTGFSHSATYMTQSSDVLALLTGLMNDLNTFFGGLVDTFTASINDSKLIIESPINSPMTIQVSTTFTLGGNPQPSPIFSVTAGREGEQDPGTWGNDLFVNVYPMNHSNGSPDGYKMEVLYKGYIVETYISDGDDWQSLIDAINLRSGYILATPIDLGVPLILGVSGGSLSGGIYNAPSDSDFEPYYDSVTQEPKGMAIFEGVDAQILASPEMFSSNYAKLCETFAAKNNKFFLFSLPYLATESVIQSYYSDLFSPNQSYCGSILNWAQVPADREGNKIWIPATGYALGAGYIRKAGLYNGYVWIPPAGVETSSKGVYRFTHDNLSEDTLGRYVKKWRTNVIKFVKNVGFCLWSSRTYSLDNLFESIHVRLETNWIIANVKERNGKFIQRLNTPTTQKTAKIDNIVWFKNLYEKGGIEKSIPFEDAVVIDVETSKENRKEVEMEIAWIPPECIEHIHIKVSRNDGILIINF